MALIVETGLGVAGAESFASVEDADAFWDARPSQRVAWMTLNQGRKEECLRLGTDYVATKLTSGTPLGGLPWPWVDQTVTAFDASRIKRATIMAAEIAINGPLVGGKPLSQRVLSESKALGPLSKSTTYANREAPAQAYGRDLSFVDDLLRGLTASSGIVIGRSFRA